MKKLVILGGGHAHIEVLRRFGLDPMPGVELTLVSPDRHTAYSGMVPGLIARHYAFEECHIDLEHLAHHARATFLQTGATAVDPVRRVVQLAVGMQVPYDLLSIDVGSASAMPDLPGLAQHTVAIRPVSAFLAYWNKLIGRVRRGEVQSLAIIGGGAGGVELLLAMHHALSRLRLTHPLRYALITDTPNLLASHAHGVRSAMEKNLARKNIEIHCNTRITGSDSGMLVTENGTRIAADVAIWATGAAPHAWLSNSGLALDDKKFININKHLQSSGHPDVFAAGDCATIAGKTYPKSGVYAVRQGPPLASNLRRALRGESLIAYTPQTRALALISTGEPHAIASWGPISVQGDWVWRWKDKIDRAFVEKYRGLPL